MSRRGRGGAWPVACLAAVLATALASSGTRADGPLAPALPPQPGTASPGCTTSPGVPGSWTPLVQEAEHQADPTDGYQFPSYQVSVDPWQPCRLYRWTDGQTLQRSVDEGRSWEVVFHDDAALVPGGPQFAASAMALPAAGTLRVGEAGNGDAAVASDDAGATWHLAGPGLLAGQPVYSMDPAPSDPSVLYASVLTRGCDTAPHDATSANFPFVAPCLDQQADGPALPTAPAALGLFVSHDGGASWTPGTLPATAEALGLRGPYRPYQLRVDPLQPGHVYVMLDTGPEGATALGAANGDVPQNPPGLVFESSDFGQTWQEVANFATGCTELLVTRDPRHGLRLFAVLFDAANQVEVSSDDGRSWQALPVPLLNYGVLAADPADQRHMLWVGADVRVVQTMHAVYSSDGMDSFTHVADLDVPQAYVTEMMSTTPLQPYPYGGSFDPTVVVQADHLGNFYVDTDSDCHVSMCSANATQTNLQLWTAHDVWRFTPPQPGPAGAAGAIVVSSVPRSATCGPLAGCTVGQPMLELRHCAIPPATLTYSGSLAFDGVDLLYTQYQETGPKPSQGVIHRMTPACSDAGGIVVDFKPDDLAAAAKRSQDPTLATTPVIDEMTYDPRRNQLWLSLATHEGDDSASSKDAHVPLFTISLDALGPGVVETPATYRFDVVHCTYPSGGSELLTYDYASDSLWTCDPQPHHHVDYLPYAAYDPGRVAAGDGSSQPTCMSGVQTPNGIATWTLGGPGHMYIQDEDDITVYEYDTATCAVQDVYRHRVFAEAEGEDEQMACDGVSFATGPTGGRTAQAALWLRDATASVVTAYAIPDGSCPLPTSLHLADAAPVPVGGESTLCASLSTRGQPRPLAQQVLQFTLRGVAVGAAPTDARGQACVTATVDVAGDNAVHVDFGGSPQYLSSSADGSVRALAAAVAQGRTPFEPPAAPPAAGSPIGQIPPNANAVSGSRQAAQATQGQLQPQTAGQGQGAPVASGSGQSEQQAAAAAALAAAGLTPDGEAAPGYEMRALATGPGPLRPILAATLAAAVALAAAWRGGAGGQPVPVRRSGRRPSGRRRRR